MIALEGFMCGIAARPRKNGVSLFVRNVGSHFLMKRHTPMCGATLERMPGAAPARSNLATVDISVIVLVPVVAASGLIRDIADQRAGNAADRCSNGCAAHITGRNAPDNGARGGANACSPFGCCTCGER